VLRRWEAANKDFGERVKALAERAHQLRESAKLPPAEKVDNA
ncbi:hypothetical protein LCGC14_1791620, partial [marine sediment metagenome]